MFYAEIHTGLHVQLLSSQVLNNAPEENQRSHEHKHCEYNNYKMKTIVQMIQYFCSTTDQNKILKHKNQF